LPLGGGGAKAGALHWVAGDAADESPNRYRVPSIGST